MTRDPFDLDRFVAAQQPAIDNAEAELAAGRKRSHWMWFVFPQLKGLGTSAMALRYGLGSLAEARAYLAHPLLGPRLRRCTDLVLAVDGRDLHAIFGSPDDLKFRSSMTLFACAGDGPFRSAIDRACGGRPDQRTLDLLGREWHGVGHEPVD
jgi:uncharacterized protein (DUF1810 family)